MNKITRALLWLASGFIILLILVLATAMILAEISRRDLLNYKAELTGRGEHLDMADVMPTPPQKEGNGAEALIAAGQDLSGKINWG